MTSVAVTSLTPPGELSKAHFATLRACKGDPVALAGVNSDWV